MHRKIIGLSANINKDDPIAEYANVSYVQSIIKAGGTPIILPVSDDEGIIEDYIALCDAFIFTGGKDIDPKFYNAEPQKGLGETSTILDEYQLALLYKALNSKKPLLGICRGFQLLNVALGGTLIQDLDRLDYTLKHTQDTDPTDTSHKVIIEKKTKLSQLFEDEIYVNSYHHQAIDKLGDGLIVAARAKDGIIEAIELSDHPFCLAVQWHPEKMLEKDDEMLVLFKRLIS